MAESPHIALVISHAEEAYRNLRNAEDLKPIMKVQVFTMSEPLITYGKDSISKKVGSQVSTIFLHPFELDDEWVQEWIKRPY